MQRKMDDVEHQAHEATRQAWEENAAFWDAKVGEGNQFQRELIGPATDELLQPQPAETILDVACGNGLYARHLAQISVDVVACDFSLAFIDIAREKSAAAGLQIEYRVVDATDREALLALGEGRFDAAVCTMALMDIATIDPLLSAMNRLLKPGGRFVFSLTHPCFNHSAMRRIVEEEDREGELVYTHFLEIRGYRDLVPQKGVGIIGQPVPHYYFHRTLSELFNRCFAAGFVLNGLAEPTFKAGADANRPFSWSNFSEIPPVLVARLIRASSR